MAGRMHILSHFNCYCTVFEIRQGVYPITKLPYVSHILVVFRPVPQSCTSSTFLRHMTKSVSSYATLPVTFIIKQALIFELRDSARVALHAQCRGVQQRRTAALRQRYGKRSGAEPHGQLISLISAISLISLISMISTATHGNRMKSGHAMPATTRATRAKLSLAP